MRLIQHKEEAWWFYRFLSVFYDKYVNPLFWTERMRDQSLELARLDEPNLTVIDVGSGTGFTTQGIVKHVPSEQVTCMDQSPHQMAKAKRKTELQGCTFQLGDAEKIPFENDRFDRYISAGSIEYWPHPEQGIREAWRVVRPGGVALVIGPLEPENRFARFLAATWMLFPKEKEYRNWFEKAGFDKIEVRYVRPQWFRRKSEYGIAIAGIKSPGEIPVTQPVISANNNFPRKKTFHYYPTLIGRVLLGSLAGFVFIPVALVGNVGNFFRPKEKVPEKYQEGLNTHQLFALLLILAVIVFIIWLIFT